ncbi:MAG: RNA polymerase-associated protein RapA [Dehalococcoidia bacterium]|nr:RNA polymerase-associated protein RapA [Chloroflexota bacterium]MBT9162794.1 RNA polymerase-associated protein RapA [Chloroflexota bacterium]
MLARIGRDEAEERSLYDLRLDVSHLSLLRGLEELLCLETLKGVEKFWYQVEVVKRVIRDFRGRVILADEVGLGKTIEAGMAIKEYLMRGMIRKVLILAPPSLVSQWQEEMLSKFDLDFVTTDQMDPRKDESFWERERFIIASINLAKSRRHFDRVTRYEYDLIVVDEVHHLKSRTTLNWKLVNALKSRFLLLLSATPVQNNLVELFNLITLLKPGLLQTEFKFKREYVKRGDPRTPTNRDKLKELMREVMIRNTRSLVDVKLPKRFASTIIVPPSEIEQEIYQKLSRLVRERYQEGEGLSKMVSNNLLREAGSSPYALEGSLAKLDGSLPSSSVKEILGLIHNLNGTEKGIRLLELINKGKGKKLIFAHYLKSLEYLADLLARAGLDFVEFRGGMTAGQKNQAIDSFRDKVDILLSMESGGEGRNIQFCNTMINYDLPWNPMRIEQRIGRIHRIGQTRDVFIFNLCLRGSIEEYILQVLDKKINMFELVIGEMDTILGNLPREAAFEDIVMDIWVKSQSEEELREGFDQLGEEMLQAKQAYEEIRKWDEVLFGDDLEV